MPQLRDVAIVGAGLLGLAAGHALTRRGRDVVVLEQAEIGHPGAGSKGACRIFRLGYPDPAYVAAARLAREHWQSLAAESGQRLLVPAPQLTIGAGLAAVHAAMQEAGAPCELLTEAEAAARFADVRTDGPALLELSSAVIAAAAALTALARLVPDVRTGVRVTRLADDGRRVTLRTTAGPVTARTAIVTSGPWSGDVLAPLGVPVPSRSTLEQVAYLRRADAAHAAPTAVTGLAGPSADGDLAPDAGMVSTPIFLAHTDRSPYGLPVPGSPLYKIGIHPSGPAVSPDAQDQSADPYLTARLTEVARTYLPGYHPEPVAIERCVYDTTPDEDFILDRTGNVVVGCGTSGHGFKFGPLLGEWLADLAADPELAARQTPQQELRERFALSRFRRPAF